MRNRKVAAPHKQAPSAQCVILMFLVLGMSAAIGSGCDTVALVSFQERDFQNVRSTGITPIAGQCGGSSGDVTLRFVLEADDKLPIKPGDVIGREDLNISASSIALADSAVFEYPDVTCSSNDDCALMGDNFTCTEARPGLSSTQRRCQRSASMSLSGPLTFESDVQRSQLLGVVFENAGSLEGWLPEDLGARYPDTTGNGVADGERDLQPDTSRASDPSRRRNVALTGLREAFTNVARDSESTNERRSLFGLWQFAGTSSADVRSLVAQVTPQNSIWARDPARFAAAANAFDDVDATRGNVYQALASVLEDEEAFADDTYADFDKTLVLLVDGPDELRLNAFDIERVIDAATDLEVRVFIVHLDSEVELTSSGVELLRDDFFYWENQDEPCASQQDCRNYEECRVPTAYATSPGGPVDKDPEGDTYCMVRRDENGRVGPIEDYQRLACETDGGYIYVKSPQALRRRMEWLPLTMDGLWKVDAVIDVVENEQVAPEQPYAVQTNLSIDAGGATRNFFFGQAGDPTAGRQDADQDTRTVIFVE